MKADKNNILSLGKNGEFIYHGFGTLDEKYSPDTPFDNSLIPYLVLLCCGACDGAVFYNLFKLISYDNPFMLAIQVVGFLFAFDVVPIFMAIQYNRVRQRLSNDRFIIILALAVFVMAFIVNIVLRVLTIDLLSPDLSSTTTSYFGTMTTTDSQASGADPSAIALTIFSIALPFLTSIGSFTISCLTYKPLLIRKQRLEREIAEKKDELRRLHAILAEYDSDAEFAEHLVEDDNNNYKELQIMQKAKTINYCTYVRDQLKEYLATPASNSALSDPAYQEIIEQLDREMETLLTS